MKHLLKDIKERKNRVGIGQSFDLGIVTQTFFHQLSFALKAYL